MGLVETNTLHHLEDKLQSLCLFQAQPKKVHHSKMKSDGRPALDLVDVQTVGTATSRDGRKVCLRHESDPMRGAPGKSHAAEVRTVIECEFDEGDDLKGFLVALGYKLVHESVSVGKTYTLRTLPNQLPVEVYIFQLYRMLEEGNLDQLEILSPDYAVVEAIVHCEEGKKMEASPVIVALQDRLSGLVKLEKPQEIQA